MDLEHAIKQLVRQTVLEVLSESGESSSMHEPLIDLTETATRLNCHISVVHALVRNASVNGFPVVWLGKKTARVDWQRMPEWMRAGGLNGSDKEDQRKKIPGSGLKAVA